MICQRCLSGEVAYYVYTDAIHMKVCAICAEEARKLGISVELIANEEGNVNRRTSNFENISSCDFKMREICH